MSSHGSEVILRQRRTVPLEDDEGNDQSTQEDNSLRSYGRSSSSHSRSNRSSRSSRRRRTGDTASSRRRRPDDSSISRRLDPARDSFKNHGSGHSRGSVSSMPSIDTDELKKKYSRKNIQRNGHTATRTPSTRSALTIGNSSVLSSTRSLVNSVASMPLHSTSGLQDLLSIERALNDCDDDQVDQLINNTPSRQQSTVSTPVAWKTPFEVDRPRLTPKVSPAPLSSGASVSTETDPHLSKEQDAWAGIDNLLEDSSGSLDGSFVFSMCDILPKDTVKAMRRGQSSADSVLGDGESIHDENASHSERMKRSLAAISKNSNGSSHSSGRRGAAATRKHKHGDSNVTNNVSADGKDQAGELQSATLFDVFHWSDKANVDNARQRTKKLNQTRRTVKMATPRTSTHSSDSDDASLPSLASFRPDELAHSRRSTGSMWDSKHHEVSSVVSEDMSLLEEFGGDNGDHGETEEQDESEQIQRTPSLAGDGLILNKQVDDYIRKMQMKLPTISEDIGSPIKNGTTNSEEQTSPSPTSIVEESPFEKFPGMASLASEKAIKRPSAKPPPRKAVEKKEPKQSLSFQFMSSIKKMGKVLPAKKPLVANGDEARYFPEPSSPAKSKKFSANRSLLSEAEFDFEDGTNWE